ncbi:hypothetical protein A7D02_07455 [Aeromonas salmonicida]|uniref:Uncharacterized protein n=1 Tax=Aeromonas salmonicida subsp. salmonicida TaxID=29491 RepID=A0A1B2LQI6_AERSS|nr:hypothetical protein [Aeromonas salmonicida]AOA33846.1 hypothetical protein [Aeromonas salmonicida subsp. salmonicida]ORJ13441.1 hypothetical protein A7D02_07455 [Aeromonas salmonicida]
MNKQPLESALHFNPFEGDFGSCGDRTLKNKIVKFRKPHICHICDAETKVGETGRNLVEIFEGEIGSFYFCQECCVAMANSVDGDEDGDEDGFEINRRYELGNERRQSKIDEVAA